MVHACAYNFLISGEFFLFMPMMELVCCVNANLVVCRPTHCILYIQLSRYAIFTFFRIFFLLMCSYKHIKTINIFSLNCRIVQKYLIIVYMHNSAKKVHSVQHKIIYARAKNIYRMKAMTCLQGKTKIVI